MNLLGHNYIAYKILGKVSPYTLLGSHIPDFVPFLPTSVFSFDEIHENHVGLLNFVKEKYPFAVNLPLSMMCHSVKYGADEFNRHIDAWLLGKNEKLKDKIISRIAKTSKINLETAGGPRLHNYLWCGVDLFIIKTNPENVIGKLQNSLKKINYELIAQILSEYYKKDENLVRKNLKDFFKPITPKTFEDTKHFIELEKEMMSHLTDGDDLDVNGGVDLVEFIYTTFENEWEEIVDNVQNKVQKKMAPFLL